MRTIRVAVNNNFNCTMKEFQQLNKIREANPDDFFFVNSNINTPDLRNLHKANYASVVTVNPNLHFNIKVLEKLRKIKEKIAFLRVKWLPEDKDIENLIKRLRREYQVVITLQRFNSKKTLLEYTSLEYYKFSNNRFRLHGEALQKALTFAKATGSYICDLKGLGCQGCGLCSTLSCGQSSQIYTLNLSSSGRCKYKCPDCYAQTMYHWVKMCGHKPRYDKIRKNQKQRGATKHIQQNWDLLAEKEAAMSLYEKG